MLCVMTPCSLVGTYQRFGVTYDPHIQLEQYNPMFFFTEVNSADLF